MFATFYMVVVSFIHILYHVRIKTDVVYFECTRDKKAEVVHYILIVE